MDRGRPAIELPHGPCPLLHPRLVEILKPLVMRTGMLIMSPETKRCA